MGWGVNWPNGPLQQGELSKILSLGLLDYVVLDAQMSDALQVLKYQPQARIHLRVDARGALDYKSDVDRAYNLWVQSGKKLASIAVRNEPQIESPGVTPDKWHLHIVNVAQTLLAIDKAIPLYLPPVSPGVPGWENWVQWACYGALAAGYRGIWVHAYGDWLEIDKVLSVHRQNWGGRILCTETNFGAGRQVDLTAYALSMPSLKNLFDTYGVDAACWFIWRWVNPDTHLQTPVDVPGTPIETALREGKVAYDVGPGVLEAMKARGDEPRSNEHYKKDVKGVQYGSETASKLGKYEWNQETGEVTFYPKA